MNNLAHLILIGFWLFGIVVAEGVLSTFFAIILPFWAWYLGVEHLAIYFGII
jgi:hypothetical protein